ncbi:MAG: PD40 domain-containing protein [Anaerolineae bacterium]|nr:PD40 domain-containing protein [Anaerolineae bacterium]
MANIEIQSLLRTGIEAVRAGNKAKARRIFERVLEIDDSNEMAWMWMASVVQTPDERRVCLENVLDINPNNERAVKALARLKAGLASSARSESKPASRITRVKPKSPPPRASAAESWGASDWDSRLEEVARPSRPAAPDRREASLDDSGGRRRPARLPILALGALGVLVVIVVAGLLLAQVGSGESGGAQGGPLPTVPTPVPTRVVLVDPDDVRETLVPPTWTPRPTETLYPSLTPSETPPPLSYYNLVFSGRQSGRPGSDIYRIRADGAEDELFPLARDDADEIDPAVAPDGADVVFISMRSGAPELYLTRADGRQIDATQLTDAGATEMGTPSWAPDGQSIVFSAVIGDEPDSELYIISLNAPRDLIPITNNQANDREPAWSPDGKTIVFASDRLVRGYWQLFMVPADCFETDQFGQCEEKVVQLTNSQYSSMSPAWSPDGRQIVFVSNRKSVDDEDVYVMRADGTDARPLTLEQYGDNGANDRRPVWSPDGRWIAFASDREARRSQVFIMASDGSQVVQVTSFLGGAASPSWLPEQ